MINTTKSCQSHFRDSIGHRKFFGR